MIKFILIVTILYSNSVLGNKIDKLKTTKDVIDFVKTVYPEYSVIRHENFKYGIFDIESTDTIYNQLKCDEIFKIDQIKNWQKIDINNDGLTDLIFIPHYYGYTQNVIIDKGNDEFIFIRNIIDFNECEYIKPIKVEGKNELWIRKANLPFHFDDNIQKYIQIDTLTYKFDAFVELNSKEVINKKIKAVEFERSSCFGTCPVFKLRIDKNGLGSFEGIDYTKYIGKSVKQLNLRTVKEMFDLIHYIEIMKLNDNYQVNYTDAPTAVLEIFFEDGSIKKIQDYGLNGTYGLSALYARLTRFGTETQW